MWLQETYNVKLHQIQKGDWGSNPTELVNFVSAPDDTLCLYIIEPGSTLTQINNGTVRTFSDLGLDLTADKWNQADLEFASKGGQVYGLYAGKTEPRQCLYFNKRVLTEAGIDYEKELYDAVENGEWTWDKYIAMLDKITRDTDNDGVIDIWGVTGDANDMYFISVFSNGGSFFKFDENGKIQPAMEDGSNTIDALNWARDEIYFKYFYQQPADGQWDYYKEAFKQGNIGFYQYQTYGGFNDGAELADAEPWGMVPFPVPNAGDPYITIASDNFTVMPNVYDDETAKKLAFIYDLWTNPTPGYEDEDDNWIGNKYNFTDDRAVDETYAMLREPEHAASDQCLYIGSINDVEGQDFLWSLGGSTPAELLESKTPVWQGLLDTFNGK